VKNESGSNREQEKQMVQKGMALVDEMDRHPHTRRDSNLPKGRVARSTYPPAQRSGQNSGTKELAHVDTGAKRMLRLKTAVPSATRRNKQRVWGDVPAPDSNNRRNSLQTLGGKTRKNIKNN
jgi:hypothetical protein